MKDRDGDGVRENKEREEEKNEKWVEKKTLKFGGK